MAGQTQIGAVDVQEQPVLGARGEHSVGLGGPLEHQVVHQHPDVRLAARQDERRFAPHLEGRVDPGHETECRGLLVPGRTVDLPRQEQPAHRLRLERVPAHGRLHEIVLDGVAGARHLGPFQAADGTHDLDLHLGRQAGGDAVQVDPGMIPPLRLDEDLVAVPVGEAHDLVLDRRAVARAGRGDPPGVQG